jgi:hypothetical protein
VFVTTGVITFAPATFKSSVTRPPTSATQQTHPHSTSTSDDARPPTSYPRETTTRFPTSPCYFASPAPPRATAISYYTPHHIPRNPRQQSRYFNMSDLCYNCSTCHLQTGPCQRELVHCEICYSWGHQYIFCPRGVANRDDTYRYWGECVDCTGDL